MSKQTGRDKYRRAVLMTSDTGLTWDLSENDKEALRHVCNLVNALAEEVAAYRGLPVPKVLEEIERIMEANG